MKIKVEQQDIDNGIASDCNECVIAKALKRNFNTNKVSVNTDSETLWFRVDNKLYETENIHSKSQNILDFIMDFDLNKAVKPFEFELTI